MSEDNQPVKRGRGRPKLTEEEKKERAVQKKLDANPKGRPPRAKVLAKKKGNRPLGRPPGDKAIMEEYKARLLASPKSKMVLDSILNAALDDEHKNQSAAWKILTERLMPISYFQKDTNSTGRSSVSITISGVGGDTTIVGEEPNNDDDTIDGEYTISDV